MDSVAEGSHCQGFGQSRDAFEQHMTACEQADQDAFDHIVLADDDFGYLGCEAVDKSAFFGDKLVERANVMHGFFDPVSVECPSS